MGIISVGQLVIVKMVSRDRLDDYSVTYHINIALINANPKSSQLESQWITTIRHVRHAVPRMIQKVGGYLLLVEEVTSSKSK